MYWVGERERIRIKKEKGENQPWTCDPILQTYRFCNVHREDDRVTRWIHSNWLRPNEEHPNMPFAMGIARMVNYPETLADIGFPYTWDPNHFISAIAKRKDRGLKTWTSAYMITGGYSAGGEPKEVIIARVLHGLWNNLHSDPIEAGDTLDAMANKIVCPGIGSFLTGQIVADIKWANKHARARDWWSWCVPGPGSVKGLNYLDNQADGKGYSLDEFQRGVWKIQDTLRDGGVGLDAQNTQNVLCELSKYIGAKYFGKRLKSGYVPNKEPL
jgi:hypothetical protein